MGGDTLSPDEASTRLTQALERIESASKRAGRSPQEVTLLAVSKTFEASSIESYIQVGQKYFGESYIQEAREKIPQVKGEADFHFIGHLQTNKAKYAVKLFSTIHALDSLELAADLNKRLIPLSQTMDCYIQVNVSGELSKSGIEGSELSGFLDQLSAYAAIKPVGLMTMAPYDPDPESARPCFRSLYELRERTAPSLKGLSMGMSGDFEVAIEEGSTIVRIGTLLFGDRY
ncbi:MAG: YggS family pyridoxal phosphate-dependent enzyme [Deltaproteobacteria bacterium]|jgi:pyridoxal phosphate enzyme (YggS family)|nr:YggS family pyridoxal phosphate-dependent enzyme [Deltaproteobacteria bacterium]